MQKILMHSVNEHDTSDFLEVTGTEDARDDRASTRGDKNPGPFFACFGEGFAEGVGRHARAVRRRCVI
jgi:hypothetical protein